MTVLVAYATRNGSTREIAEWIGDELRAGGSAVDVRAVTEVADLAGYQAVILGSCLYLGGWHVDARRFAHRFAGDLARRPTWLFSSGPLDRSAEQAEVPPVQQAATVQRVVRARGHVTFGGRLSDDAHGWIGVLTHRMLIADRGDDFRNQERVRRWARAVGAELRQIDLHLPRH